MTLVVTPPKVEESKMYESPIKTRIRQTVRFVQRHQTLCACAATAVITARMTRDSEITALKDTAIWLINERQGEFQQAGAMLQDYISFVDARGLTQEFMDWAPRLRQ